MTCQPRAVVEPRLGAERSAIDGDDGASADHAHLGQRREPIEERAPNVPVLDDVAERAVSELAGVVVQEQRRGAVGDADLQDRPGVGRHGGPCTDRIEHLSAARGDGRGAPVERRIRRRFQVLSVDDANREPGAAERRGQCQPDHAAADDQDVAIIGAIVRFQPIGDRRHGAKMGARDRLCPARSRGAAFAEARKSAIEGGNGLTSINNVITFYQQSNKGQPVVPRRKGTETVKLQLTVPKATERILERMCAFGIQGRNKAEVASWIITSWIWENQQALERNGVSLGAHDQETSE